MHALLNQWMKKCYIIINRQIPILTIEEAVLQGGFGSAVLEYAQIKAFMMLLLIEWGFRIILLNMVV